jgi:hypothetical protein
MADFSPADLSPTVAALTYYPVKGCAGISVERARITETGLTHDRSFMLAKPGGAFLSQRLVPAMATVVPSITEDGAVLTVTAPEAEDAKLDVRFDGDRRPVSMHGTWSGVGVDQGDEIADWFATVLGQECRLLRVPPDHDRDSPGEYVGKAGFSDAHPLLILSLSSLDSLNERILARGAEPVPMNRFRPNLVIAGWPQPHTEDRMRRMSAGPVEIGYASECPRCTVPMVEQATGRRDGPEPIRSLADYRRRDRGVTFGANAAVLRTGEVAVGDPVLVHDWAA